MSTVTFTGHRWAVSREQLRRQVASRRRLRVLSRSAGVHHVARCWLNKDAAFCLSLFCTQFGRARSSASLELFNQLLKPLGTFA